VISRVKS